MSSLKKTSSHSDQLAKEEKQLKAFFNVTTKLVILRYVSRKKHNYIYFRKTSNQPLNLTSPLATVNRDKRRFSANTKLVEQLKTVGKVHVCDGEGM